MDYTQFHMNNTLKKYVFNFEFSPGHHRLKYITVIKSIIVVDQDSMHDFDK